MVEGEIGISVKRVVVVDDDSNSRLSCEEILQATTDFKLAGSFSDAGRVFGSHPQLQPDLMLFGVSRIHSSGVAWIKAFKQVLVALTIIILTGAADADLIETWRQAGAESCLIKPVTADQCLATLRFTGSSGISTGMNQSNQNVESLRPTTAANSSPLNPRENEVMSWLAEGLLYKEIAEKVAMSEAMVHKYQHRIYQKLRVENRSEAIRVWLKSSPPV